MIFIQIAKISPLDFLGRGQNLLYSHIIRNYHYPYNVNDYFLVQNMVVNYHIMFHALIICSILIQQILNK